MSEIANLIKGFKECPPDMPVTAKTVVELFRKGLSLDVDKLRIYASNHREDNRNMASGFSIASDYMEETE